MNYKNILIAVSICLFSINLFSQGRDYLEIIPRSELLECGSRDSIKTKILLEKLLNINPDSISSNKSIYYHDIAMCYYKIFIISNDTNYYGKILSNCEKSVEADSTYGSAYNTLYIIHLQRKNYNKVVEYIEKYIKYSPKGSIKKDEMRELKRIRKKFLKS